MQAAVVTLVLIGAASTFFIGWAIQDIYTKLDRATVRLCLVEVRADQLTTAVQRLSDARLPPPRLAPRECRAKPGK